MGKRQQAEVSSLVRCGGCGGMFEPERRNQRYHDEACHSRRKLATKNGISWPRPEIFTLTRSQ